jgi:hypothetical protein
MAFIKRNVKTEFVETPRSAAFNTPRGITASAVRVNLSKKPEVEVLKKRLDNSRRWQKDAYDYVELIGELSFAADMVANTISKIRLFPGFITAEDTAPANIFSMDDKDVSPELKKAALETLRLLRTGDGGEPGILRDTALNLFIAGECFLVKEPAPADSFGAKDSWQVRSVDEIVIKDAARGSKKVFLKGTRDDMDSELIPLGAMTGPNQLFIGRIWRNSPRYSKEAVSSLKPQLENCDMVLLYDRAKRGIVRSKLNAGLFFVPDGIAAAASDDGEIEEPTDLADGEMAPVVDETADIEEQIMDVFTTPIQDESAVSAVAPTILRGPGEMGVQMRHITFAREFDPQITSDAARTLERILLGIDLPKEVVAGLTDAKYANAVVVEDNFYKSHIEPMILSIVDSFTALLMRPVLRSMGFSEEEIARVVVWYDPSPVSTKPDKATAATTGLEMGAVSYEAWRRANGFSETDKPSGLERIQRVAITRGLLSEPVTEAAMASIAPELFEEIRALTQGQTDPDTQAAVEEVLEDEQPPATEAPAEDTGSATPSGPAATPPVPLIEP